MDADVRAGGRIGLLCDNPFAPFILDGLRAAGLEVELVAEVTALSADDRDAVVIALDPFRSPPLGSGAFAHLRNVSPRARIAQFWGDVDRAAAAAAGFHDLVPAAAPGPGHMGILLNALGPEPIIRLQAGGLRAAEFVRRGGDVSPGGVAELV